MPTDHRYDSIPTTVGTPAQTCFQRCCRVPTLLLLSLLAAGTGCRALFEPVGAFPVTTPEPSPTSEVPRELSKVSLPPYIIEPPDVLQLTVFKVVPKAPHMIDTFDVINLQVGGAFPEQPIFGAVQVDPDGRVDLGPAYGKVKIIGLTIDEAKVEILTHLRQILQEPEVSVALIQSAGAQQIAGPHLVHPDGTVNLGTYGTVYLAGLTIPQAQLAVEKQLSEFLDSPQVVINVYTYASKVFYIIAEGSGSDDTIVRLPITGNETVLDAIGTIQGLSPVASKRIWISRPAPNGVGCEQILNVDWKAITRGASTATNYQLMPGDRLFIAADRLQSLDALIGKMTRPFERLFGFNILGVQMINRLRNVGNLPQRRF